MPSLYQKCRPRRFDRILGPAKTAISSLKQMVSSEEIPQVFLFHGPSGSGKTTTGRLLAAALNCSDVKDGEPCGECAMCEAIFSGKDISDVYERNMADTRGIDDTREIIKDSRIVPLLLKHKIYILDEFHSTTKDAQNSILKLLEDTPKRVVIILCSTEPTKILRTIRTRCTTIKFEKASVLLLSGYLKFVSGRVSSKELPENVCKLLAEASNGSFRMALVLLEELLGVENPEDIEVAKKIVGGTEEEDTQIIALAFALTNNKKNNWKSISKAYQELLDQSFAPEGMRLVIAGFLRNKLLKGENPSLYARMLRVFLEPLYDAKPENKLVYSLWLAHEMKNEK